MKPVRIPSRWPVAFAFAGALLVGAACWFFLAARVANAPVARLPIARPEASSLRTGGNWTVAGDWDVTLTPFDAGKFLFPEIMGPGCALFDYDDDGDLDVYLIAGAESIPSAGSKPKTPALNRLLKQTEPGKFEDVSLGSGLDVADVGMGIAIGDVNNDGWPDVYLASYGADRLLLNSRDGQFVDVTSEAGIADTNWSTSACFVDYDRDGWLDLCVVNYLDYDPGRPCADAEGQPDYCNPKLFEGVAARLYRNISGASQTPGVTVERPRFQDMSWDSGIGKVKGPGLGVISGDFNGDKYPDLFVANDGAANHLWINQRDGTFAEEAILRSAAYDNQGRPQAGMGIALADPDRDGDADLVVTHLRGENNAYYINDPQVGFTEESAVAGLAAPGIPYTGFGTAFFDLELDGDLDLAVVNGDVRRSRLGTYNKSQPMSGTAFWGLYAQRNQLFVNDGQKKFSEVAPFSDGTNVGRGLATGDVDNDGDIDLLVSASDGTNKLYLNQTPRQGHWLLVRAIEPNLGRRDALGAKIQISSGKERWTGWVNSGGSYLSSSDPRVHFGIGQTTTVDVIHVVWPNGDEERFAAGEADRQITVSHGEGTKP